MPKRTKNLIHELIRSVEDDINSIEAQLAAVGANKIVDIYSQREPSSLRKLRLQYEVLLSVLRDELTRSD
jgi:hypothetical protein